MIQYVMSWQDYSLTLAEILAWPLTTIVCIAILTIGWRKP